MKKIYLIYPSFKNIGGAHNVIIDIYLGLKDEYDVTISGYHQYSQMNPRYKEIIPESAYEKLSLIRAAFSNALIMSHDRKLTTKLILMTVGQKKNIIHVAHNEFFTKIRYTLYPKNIIAVSGRVKNNLVIKFQQKPRNITVIQNGVKDVCTNFTPKKLDRKNIKILFPARITIIKNQIELVKSLQNKLGKGIKIYFVGDGNLLPKLKKLCQEDDNFFPLGYRKDMQTLYSDADFVMLFTLKEGLPIALIEAAMMGKPIICNDVGGNLEVAADHVNGYVCNTYSDLLNHLNNIQDISQETYNVFCWNSRDIYLKKFKVEQMVNAYKKYIAEANLEKSS